MRNVNIAFLFSALSLSSGFVVCWLTHNWAMRILLSVMLGIGIGQITFWIDYHLLRKD